MEFRPESFSSVQDLVMALERATLMAKQLPTTSSAASVTAGGSAELFQIYSSLQTAHHHLSSFLSRLHPQQQPPPPAAAVTKTATENSLSSAIGGGGDNDDNEPMQLEEYEEQKVEMIDRVEERLRDCFIQSKRPKRTLSPSAEGLRSNDGELDRSSAGLGFDPHGSKLKSLELVYQFHA
ncbi:hypothetical protein RJ641_016865 [Dillenia turbinata]|uniref:Uncharacterized protein n=1 Tax=Dillenia turbinata TaxID=194707 RepID=A0AAN8UKC6_9MAGN